MIVFPNGKINLGLNVVERRPDGYHNLETIFYPIGIRDILEVVPAGSFHFETYGESIAGDTENNLCVRAYQLLKKKFSDLPPVDIGLFKKIPMGAGLGGGSADGAFMMRVLNEIFKLNIPTHELIRYAAHLGSDCPFFIVNRPSFASGRGELLDPVDVSLSAYTIVLVHPVIQVSTAWAFSKIKPKKPAKPIREIIQAPIEKWKDQLINDFEEPVFVEYPPLKEIKQELYNNGALYAAMSGSGSSIYGIFSRNKFSTGRYSVIFEKFGHVTVVS